MLIEMTRPLLFVALTGLFQILTSSSSLAVEKEVWEQVSHNVRVMRHRDGTNTEYRRSNDEKTLVKRRISSVRGAKNSVLTVTVYRMDNQGNPLACKIYDGKKNLLYKVSYGYHRETGQLIAEDMLDARVPQIDAKTGKPIPVRRMYWFYDGAGNVTRAFSFVWRKGKYAEEAFDNHKTPSNFPTDNPFRKGSTAGTPAAPKSKEAFQDDDFAPPRPLPPSPFAQ